MITKQKLEQLGWEINKKSNKISLIKNDVMVEYYTEIDNLNFINYRYDNDKELQLIYDYLKELENEKILKIRLSNYRQAKEDIEEAYNDLEKLIENWNEAAKKIDKKY